MLLLIRRSEDPSGEKIGVRKYPLEAPCGAASWRNSVRAIAWLPYSWTGEGYI